MPLSCPQCQSVLDTPADLHQSGEEFLCTQCHTLLKLTVAITIIEPSSQHASAPTSGPAPARRVAVVFHGEASLEMVRDLLASAGFEVIAMRTGRDALHQIDQLQPAVVVIEDDLPDLSGLDLCELLKRSKRHHGLKVLRIIGKPHPTNDREEATLLYGPDDQLPRASLYRELVKRVHALMQRESADRYTAQTAHGTRIDPDATRVMDSPQGPRRP
jgi:DNA-binding response OmpR family regulator